MLALGLRLCGSRHDEVSVRQKLSQNANLVTDQENAGKVGEVRFVFSYRCEAPRTISAGSRLVATNSGSCMPAYIDRI